MRVKITKPCWINVLEGEVEVTEQEYQRMVALKLVEPENKKIDEAKTAKRKKK